MFQVKETGRNGCVCVCVHTRAGRVCENVFIGRNLSLGLEHCFSIGGYTLVALIGGDFVPQGTFDNVSRHFLLS